MIRFDLTQSRSGGVNIKVPDNSCTHPSIGIFGEDFRHGAYFSTSVEDVREGYLEVIEMGEVSETATVLNNGQPQLIASQGILHEQPSGVPFDCGVINQAWLQGTFTPGGAAVDATSLSNIDPDAVGYPVYNSVSSDTGFYGLETVSGLTAPMGGLVGTSILVDVPNLAGYVAEPIAINNYATKAQHYLSSDQNFYLLPSLASGNVMTSEYLTYDAISGNPDLGEQYYAAVQRDWGLDDQNVLPRESVPSGSNPMPIANAMLITEIGNQYFLNDESTSTDWVISAPMRKHAIYNNYQYVTGTANYVVGVPATVDAEGDFVPGVGDIPVGGQIGDAVTALGYWRFLENAVDVNAEFAYWNTEEGQRELDPGDFSPPIVTPPDEVPFEREVNILALQSANLPVASVLGSDNAQGLQLEAGYTEGWGGFIFDSYNLHGVRYGEWVIDNSDVELGSGNGVPLFGFMAARTGLNNGFLGETFPHFYSKDRDIID